MWMYVMDMKQWHKFIYFFCPTFILQIVGLIMWCVDWHPSWESWVKWFKLVYKFYLLVGFYKKWLCFEKFNKKCNPRFFLLYFCLSSAVTDLLKFHSIWQWHFVEFHQRKTFMGMLGLIFWNHICCFYLCTNLHMFITCSAFVCNKNILSVLNVTLLTFYD